MLTVSWELDLWGRVRYGRAAASADAGVGCGRLRVRAPVDRRARRQELVPGDRSGACRPRWRAPTIRDGEELVRLAEDRIAHRRRQRRRRLRRARLGRDVPRHPAPDRAGARAGDSRAGAADRPLSRRGGDGHRRSCPGSPPPFPPGLPSELLERRPDVVAAERRVAAAFNRVHEAKAARLPTIALTTGVSAISSDLFVLQDHDNPVWNVGANLLAPIYKGGALKTQVEIRTAEQKQARRRLRVGRPARVRRGRERARRPRSRRASASRSSRRRSPTIGARFEIVQTQFKVGSTDLRFVTQRQLALNATQSALIRMQAEQRVQRVNLHLALGGSFDAAPSSHQRFGPRSRPDLPTLPGRSRSSPPLEPRPACSRRTSSVRETRSRCRPARRSPSRRRAAAPGSRGTASQSRVLTYAKTSMSSENAPRRKKRTRTDSRSTDGCSDEQSADAVDDGAQLRRTSSRSAAPRSGGTRTCRAPRASRGSCSRSGCSGR